MIYNQVIEDEDIVDIQSSKLVKIKILYTNF